MESKIPFSGKEAKGTAKTHPLSPSRDRKRQKYLDPTERGKPNDIAHGSIIRDCTASELKSAERIIHNGSTATYDALYET